MTVMIRILFLFITMMIFHPVFAFENLVYTWRGFPGHQAQGKIEIQEMKDHAAKINIWSSQAYHINAKGKVDGSLNAQMLQVAREQHIKIMPLVGNTNLDRKVAHDFLNNPAAEQHAIQFLLKLCQDNHFDGLQIDFEGMWYTDKEAYTKFYQNIAAVLHKNGFLISVAVIPALSDDMPATGFWRSQYKGWSGVYDYPKLAACSDFVTLMAYDQHGDGTTPGPEAGLAWDEAMVTYALKYIPANKISLGIPWHSGYWYVGKENEASSTESMHVISVDLTYPNIKHVLDSYKVDVSWNDIDKVHYAIFNHDFHYAYVYLEDSDSYKAKLDLVKKYQLHGVSNWCLGEEDPAVWNLL